MLTCKLIDDVGPALAGKVVFLPMKTQRLSRPLPGFSREGGISADEDSASVTASSRLKPVPRLHP